MDTVLVRLYAAARAAFGQSEISVKPGSLEEILMFLANGKPRLSQVFSQCSYLVDGLVVHDKTENISTGSTLDVLPPFAGGC